MARRSDALLLACEVAVLRALEIAAKRCRTITRGDRFAYLDREGVPHYALHTKVSLANDPAEVDRLFAGAWDHLALVLPRTPAAIRACDEYTRHLIAVKQPHSRAALAAALADALPTPTRDKATPNGTTKVEA